MRPRTDFCMLLQHLADWPAGQEGPELELEPDLEPVGVAVAMAAKATAKMVENCMLMIWFLFDLKSKSLK